MTAFVYDAVRTPRGVGKPGKGAAYSKAAADQWT